MLPPVRPVKGRPAKQNRSSETLSRISDAAVALIAEKGIAGLTHRLVADRAGVPLAATTYYFKTKFDILAQASNASMGKYSEAFARAAARYRGVPDQQQEFSEFAFRLAGNAAGVHRPGTIAWAEIMLDAVRHPESLLLAQDWMAHIKVLWTDIAEAMGRSDAHAIARSGIDTVIGLNLITVALGLDRQELDAVLVHQRDPAVAWSARFAHQADDVPVPSVRGRKGDETRQRILDAAIEILISEGAAAVNFRQIALRAGLSAAAPAYHFPDVDALLRAAQARLFESSKERYRRAVAPAGNRGLDLEHLIDLTAVVLQREATESGAVNLATFAIWLEAVRKPELRAMVWSAVADQCRAWQRLLGSIAQSPSPPSGLLAQAIFLGKLVRILSTGAETSDLVTVRREFARDLGALADGTHWALSVKE